MGPDALELCRDHHQWVKHIRAVANRRGLKSMLLDQSVIAGVGNIYAVEGLFAAKAHPLSRVNELTDKQLCALATGIESSMHQTLHDFSTEGYEIIYDSSRGLNSAFAVYGREGLPCPLCESLLAMIRLNGRATVYCPTCQAKGSSDDFTPDK